jgi:glutamate/tyrosine decarboxylase-like PLP-dependent enzyme
VDDRTLRRAAELALDFLGGLPERPVGELASIEELRTALDVPLEDASLPPLEVVERLAAAVEPGLVASAGPRYFGFVIGGSLPSALAADWLTSAWDQNAGGYPVGPSASVAEEVACAWLLDLLGLPADAGVGLTTGCQMAHVTCLAAARHRVLRDAGWDVEAEGLFGAPTVRVLVNEQAHTTVFAALRLLGFGSGRSEPVPADDQGRMRVSELEALLAGSRGPAIVIAQAGDVNTGAIDALADITRLALEHGAWCHIDGAFGLWATASPTLRGLVDGAADADSWATDAHKWLNVPYDCGIAIVRDRLAHAAAMNSFEGAAYIPGRAHDERNESEWVPEFSRRARGFTVYAALRELGRRGAADLVERCCAHARLMAELLAVDDGVTVLNDVVLNQVLVRFGHDAHNATDEVIRAVQRDGTCWMSGTRFAGESAMRISVCNWRTTDEDIRRSAAAILACATTVARHAARGA